MNFFEWLNGPEKSEIDRAIALLKKQTTVVHMSAPPIATSNMFLVGTYKSIELFSFASMMGRTPKRYFDHYTVKFSSDGSKAMISKKGSVDFFFTSKEEVDALREVINNHV